jgi:WD40 repeat protein
MTEGSVIDSIASSLCSSVDPSEATEYVVTPIALAVHPSAIFSICSTTNFRWLFTGGEDGFVRKFDMAPTLNGDNMLTLNQKHGFPDSVQKAAVLVSAYHKLTSDGKQKNLKKELKLNYRPFTQSTFIQKLNGV